MLARALLLILTCLLAIACGGSTASPSGGASPSVVRSALPSTSASPNSSAGTVDEVFCGTIADLESALQTFESTKIKASNGSKLKDLAAGVTAALAPISDSADASLGHQVAALSTAVDGLKSSAENYATASPSGAAAAEKKIKKALTTLHAAIAQLRQAATCST